MSEALSDYGENAFLRHIFRTSGGVPGTVYLALTSTGTISESMTMSSLTEPSSSNGYSRMPLSVPSNTDWPTVGQSYLESKEVQWSPVSNPWNGLYHIVLCDSALAAANIIAYRPLENASPPSGASIYVAVGQSLTSTFRFSQE